jgi:hypothetical protein
MRAREFIFETDGQITKRQQVSTTGFHLYKDSERWNSDYTMNRLMMAVASTDGKIIPDLDDSSYVGKHKTAHPYTQVEADMLKIAYKVAGATYTDVNDGDMDSEELESTNTQSVLKPFKGL